MAGARGGDQRCLYPRPFAGRAQNASWSGASGAPRVSEEVSESSLLSLAEVHAPWLGERYRPIRVVSLC